MGPKPLSQETKMELLGFPLLGAEKKWECYIQTLGAVRNPRAKSSPELLHIC